MRLAFKIAFRFLSSSKLQTLFIVLGIAIGVSVQVFIGSLIQGLQKSLIETTIGRTSHVTINSVNDDRKIKNWQEILESIKSENFNLNAISPAADASAFIKAGKKTFPVLLRGFIYEEANKIYRFEEVLIEGEMPDKAHQVLMGIDLKRELEADLKDRITLIAPDGSEVRVTITGFYDFKVSSINETWLITDLKTAQNVFSLGKAITSIEMQTEAVFEADKIAQSLSNRLKGYELKVNNWKDQNEQLLSGLRGQSMSSYLIQVFVMVSVVLGIASVLAITVLQKSRQLGILKAMGIRDSTASQIFLFEGFILGSGGALLGVALGLGLTYTFTKFAVNPDGTPIITLYIDPVFITLSALIALLASTGAALIPARRSAKISPIEVIKNG